MMPKRNFYVKPVMKLVMQHKNIARHQMSDSLLSFSLSQVMNKEKSIFVRKRPKTGKIPP
jgi:hypothetical protein